MRTIHVMFDSGLTSLERESIRDGLIDFKERFPNKDIVNYRSRQWSTGSSYCSADWFIRQARLKQAISGSGLNVEVLLDLMREDPGQKAYPHIDVLFTSCDLTRRGLKTCYGATSDRFTVQSLYRYRYLRLDDRIALIKWTLWHELGHMLGLSNNIHCANRGCAMHQGKDFDETIRFAREMTRTNRIYCPDCTKKISYGGNTMRAS
ncbi:hypothetical protein IKF30_03035 [Candidatus Saccharibacteria bacterium]|nr:hypothetical protein [Candidatus Saccharibacteria bacterium]